MSDGERYVMIALVVSLVLRGEAVAHVNILYVVHDDTHKSPLVFHYRGFGLADQVPL